MIVNVGRSAPHISHSSVTRILVSAFVASSVFSTLAEEVFPLDKQKAFRWAQSWSVLTDNQKAQNWMIMSDSELLFMV